MPNSLTPQLHIDKIRNDVTELQKSMAQISVLVEKMDITIEKLTDLSSNVTSLLAVHEQRLAYYEQNKVNVNETLNQQRLETSEKLKDVYATIEKKNDDLLKKFDAFSVKLDEKINSLQKYIWIAIGGGAVVMWVMQYGYSAISLVTKIHS